MSGATPLPLRFALRELRGGLKGFRIFVACLILGVAAIAGVGSLTRSLEAGMAAEGQSLLGGDLEVRLFQETLTEDQEAFLEQQGQLSRSARLRTNARTDANSTLVELKTVEQSYPLYGDLELDPALGPDNPRDSIFAQRDGVWGAAIDPLLADRLEIDVGDQVKVGNATFEVRALLISEPDRSNQGFQLGPTLMTDWQALQETGLVRLGSLINYYYKLKLPPETDLQTLRDDLSETWPEADWRLRDRTNAAPGIRRFLDQFGTFLTLVGLTALLVGGVGVSNAVRSYLDSRTGTIATLKILGAEGATVFRIYLAQIMILAGGAVVAGLVIGALLPIVLSHGLSSQIPVPPVIALYPAPLVTAAVYGLLITLAFAVWPLGKARDVPAARLFRTLITPDTRWPRRRYLIMAGAALLLVVLAAIGLSDLKLLAAGFVGAAAVSLGLLRLTGWAIQKLAAKMPRVRHPGLRMAIANMHRPGAATGAVVMSLGLGLTLFATLALVEGNMARQISANLPEEAPAFFFVDIQPDQYEEFTRLVEEVPGAGEIEVLPYLRGQITKVNGTPAAEVEPDPEVRWVLRGDRGITYVDDVPPSNTLTAGEWWSDDYSGPPLISFGAEAAAGLGVGVGDTLTVSVLGREITATIASLREIDWGTFGFNFIILFDPNTLKAAPHTYIATMKATGAAEVVAHRQVTRQFPNITVVRMKEVLQSVNDILDQVGTAIRWTAVVTVLAGILVLAGAMAAGHRHRLYDAVILKVLGAVRNNVLGAFLIEYLLLGLVTAMVALVLGGLAGWVVVEQVMEFEFTLLPGAMIITVAASVGITIFFGLSGTWRALSARPAGVLRAP